MTPCRFSLSLSFCLPSSISRFAEVTLTEDKVPTSSGRSGETFANSDCWHAKPRAKTNAGRYFVYRLRRDRRCAAEVGRKITAKPPLSLSPRPGTFGVREPCTHTHTLCFYTHFAVTRPCSGSSGSFCTIRDAGESRSLFSPLLSLSLLLHLLL